MKKIFFIFNLFICCCCSSQIKYPPITTAELRQNNAILGGNQKDILNGMVWFDSVNYGGGGGSGWQLTGNTGTSYNPQVMTNWIGTTDVPNSGLGFGLSSTIPCGNIDNGGSVYFGIFAGYSDNTVHDNNSVGIGSYALYNNPSDDGGYNTAIGAGSLYNNVNGYYDVATGVSSGYGNVNGYDNVYDGAYSGQTNINGYELTFCGEGADVNADGYSNSSAFGNKAEITTSNQIVLGNSVTDLLISGGGLGGIYSGYYSAGYGYEALLSNTGNNNNAFGWQSLGGGVTGSDNNAFGVAALSVISSGSNNIGIGNGVLTSEDVGNSNIAIGSGALSGQEGQSNNTAIGQSAGTDGDGSNNTYLGALTDDNLGTATNSTAIGYGASLTSSNQMMFGNGVVHYNFVLANYVSDAAAGLAGLVTGDLYQTSGVVMIKQ